MPAVLEPSSIFGLPWGTDDPASTPISTAAASYVDPGQPTLAQPVYRRSQVFCTEEPPRPTTAPAPKPSKGSPAGGGRLARTAPRRRYQGNRSDGVSELLHRRQAVGPSIDERKPRQPAAVSRRLARTMPHMPQPTTVLTPLDGAEVAFLHRQLQRHELCMHLGKSYPRLAGYMPKACC